MRAAHDQDFDHIAELFAAFGPFTYAANARKRAVMSYWKMPERLYDDPDELTRWAAQALAVARSKAAKVKSRPKGRATGRARKR